MKIIVEEFSDLSPTIRKLFEKKHLPEHIQTRLKRKESVLRRVVNSIEEGSEVRYPQILIKPYAYVTPIEFEPPAPSDQEILGYVRPYVLSAFTFLAKISDGFTLRVGLSAAALLLTDEKELTGILGHEFLHYAYNVCTYCVWQKKGSSLRKSMEQKLMKQHEMVSRQADGTVAHYELMTRMDEEKLASPEAWFRTNNIIDCVETMKRGGKAARSLVRRIMDKWFAQDLPWLPFEIEDWEIKMKHKGFQLEKLIVDRKMLEKAKAIVSSRQKNESTY